MTATTARFRPPAEVSSLPSTGYKQTVAGVIPVNWQARCLERCLSSTPSYGINAPAVPPRDGALVYLRITDIGDDGLLNPLPRVSLEHPDARNYLLRDGDLVFACTGASVGKSYLYTPGDGPLVFAGFLIRASPNPTTLQPAFLFYYVQSKRYWDWVATTSTRSGQPGINGREYAELPIPSPELPEQRAISEALSDVDGLLQALEALIAKKRAIKRAAMQQLLTGKTRLPGFRSKWKVRPLGTICTFLRTASNPRSHLDDNGDVEYIHYGDVHAHPQPVVNCTTYSLPRIAAQRVGNATPLRNGDLVMVDASEDLDGVGKSVEVQEIADRRVVAGLHTILCRGDDNAWAVGFKAYLQFIPSFRSALARLAAGTSVYAISARQLASVELRVPPRSEQAAIVCVLSEMDAQIAALEQRIDKTRAVKQGMMQQLLTGRVRLIESEATAAP